MKAGLKSMRILLDAREGQRNPTGIGQVVRGGIESIWQIDKENEYVIVPGNFSSSSRKIITSKTINLVRHLFWKQVYVPFMALWKRADIILTLAPEAPFLTRRPVVIMVHDMIFFKLPRKSSGLWGAYWRRIVPLSVKKASMVIVNSGYTKKDVIEITGVLPDKIKVCHLGVNPPQDGASTEKFEVIKPYFLFIGNLEPRRGVEELLTAFHLFLKKHPEFKLVIAGRPNSYGRHLMEKTKNESIRFVGFVAQEDLPSLYMNSFAYVYPSHYEGFGLTVLEAMSYGCPVITTDASSLPEVAGGAASMVPPGDPVKLAEAMAEMVEKRAHREKLINDGYKNIERFKWNDFARGVVTAVNAAT